MTNIAVIVSMSILLAAMLIIASWERSRHRSGEHRGGTDRGGRKREGSLSAILPLYGLMLALFAIGGLGPRAEEATSKTASAIYLNPLMFVSLGLLYGLLRSSDAPVVAREGRILQYAHLQTGRHRPYDNHIRIAALAGARLRAVTKFSTP